MSHIAFSGGIAIWAIKDGTYEYQNFTGTAVGLQAAIEHVASGTGEVFIGPGTLLHGVPFYIHSGCRIRGAGKGITVLQRTALNFSGANYSGNTFTTTKVGATTPPTLLADVLSDITIEDITLDGNESAFTQGINPGNVRHMAIYATYVNRMVVRNVEMKNFLQTGAQFDSCGNVLVYGCHIHETGQCTVASARNGISIINNQAAVSPYGHNCIVTRCLIQNINDTSVDFANVSDCQYTDSIVENPGSLCVEFESDSAFSATMSNITIARIQVTGLYTNFISIPAHAGVTVSDIKILDNTINCINQGSAMGGVFLTATTLTAAIHSVIIRGNSIRWPALSGSGNVAINLTGNVSNVQIKDNYLENVPGVGIQLANQLANATLEDIEITGNVVDQCSNYGIALFFGGGLDSTIQRIKITNNTIIDAAQSINYSAIALLQTTSSTGQILQDVQIFGNTAYRISGVGTFNWGVRFYQTGVGILDRVFLGNNVFKNMAIAPYGISNGTPTNISLQIVPGRGTNITAAATISIPTDGDVFHVTGATNITNGITVQPWDNGRTVKLIFDSTPTVSDTGTSKLQGDFVATADDVLTLTCDGTNWYEVARSPN